MLVTIYKKNNKNGFTLMELLVTVILVAVLASYGVYYYSDVMDEGKTNAAKGKLAALGGATARFLMENAASLECSYALDAGEGHDVEYLLTNGDQNCVGVTIDQPYYMLDAFRCGYAEKSLGSDENFSFYFGCPSEYSCGDLNEMTVYMKPKQGVSGNFPACAYFDPNYDKVIEVRN